MNNEKDLSIEVKTVLHGEVLGPEEEPHKKSKEEEEIERLRAELVKKDAERQAYSAQQNLYNSCSPFGSYLGQPLRDQYWIQSKKSNLFGCMQHCSGQTFPCRNCGQY